MNTSTKPTTPPFRVVAVDDRGVDISIGGKTAYVYYTDLEAAATQWRDQESRDLADAYRPIWMAVQRAARAKRIYDFRVPHPESAEADERRRRVYRDRLSGELV